MREWLRINHWVGGTIAESLTGAELLRSCRAQVTAPGAWSWSRGFLSLVTSEDSGKAIEMQCLVQHYLLQTD